MRYGVYILQIFYDWIVRIILYLFYIFLFLIFYILVVNINIILKEIYNIIGQLQLFYGDNNLPTELLYILKDRLHNYTFIVLDR